MREDDLFGEDGVVVGHVRIWESHTVLEFDLQTFSEILQPDLLGFAADLLERIACASSADIVNVGVLLQSLIPRLLHARPTSSFVTRFEDVIKVTPSGRLTAFSVAKCC